MNGCVGIVIGDISIVRSKKSRGNMVLISVASAFIVFVCLFFCVSEDLASILFIYFVIVDAAVFYIFSVLLK